MQEGCEPEESLGTGGTVSCFCPSGSAGGGRCWAWQCHPDEVSGSGQSQASGTREPKGQKNEAQQTEELPPELSTNGPRNLGEIQVLTPHLSSLHLLLGQPLRACCYYQVMSIFCTSGGRNLNQKAISLGGVGCFSTKEHEHIFPLFVALFIWGLAVLNVIGRPAVMGSVTEGNEEVPSPKSTHRCTQQCLHCCYS